MDFIYAKNYLIWVLRLQDTRNSKVFDLHDNLIAHGIDVDVYDPIISPEEKQNIVTKSMPFRF